MPGYYDQPPLKPGDVLTAHRLTAIETELRRLGRVRGGEGVTVRHARGGLQMTAVQPNNRYLCKASGNIDAASGDTPADGVVALCWLNPATGNIETTGETKAVKNPSTSTMTSGYGIDSGQLCWIDQDIFGTWWVVPLECS